MMRCLAACGLVSAIGIGLAGPAAADARYQVVWREGPVADVTADLMSSTCTFGTSSQWASFFEGDDQGWSRFILRLRAAAPSGRRLPVTGPFKGQWQVGARAPCRVRLSYAVDFAFGRQVWSAGNEQVAWTDGQAVYTTGLPLFLVSEADTPAEIAVVTPRGWTFTSPWREIGPGRFAAPDRNALLSNTLVAGKAYTGAFDAGRMQVRAAILGDLQSGAPLFQQAFTTLAPAFADLFGDERPGQYMFVLIPGSEDGESFANSFAVSTSAAPSQRNRIVWANHLAHEVLHYWIGRSIAPADDQRERFKWFTEGFTEYLANDLLLRTGVYSAADYRERMARHAGLYLMTRQNPNFMEVAPVDAGARSWRNRPLIYSGGAMIAFCLNMRIRVGSGGARSLRDVMRELHRRAEAGERITDAGLKSVFSAAAGEDLTAFYADYVLGVKSLPIEACAAQADLKAQVQGYDVFLEPAA